MAEYAGLEIRIGGNTTSLNKALATSTKSAAELQSRIRQITRAMKFDPTNLENVETRIRITANRMESLQSKAQLARTAMEQLGDKTVTLGGKSKSVRDVVNETDNLSLKAKQADARFVDLRDSLATVYETWNRAARNRGVDFMRDQLGIDAKTASSLMSTNTSLDTMLTELREINAARRAGLDNRPVIEPDQIEVLKQLKTLDFHGMFEKGTGLDELLQQARDLGVAIDDNVIEAVRNMRTEFVGAQQDKKALDSALQFDQLGTDIQRIDSEVQSLSGDIRRLDDGMTEVSRSEPFQGLESQLREADAAIDNVNHDLERTESALKLSPDNLDLAVRRFSDLQQQVDLSQERASVLRQELEMLDTDEVREAAEGHRDLAQWVEESAESARKANIEWSDQKATVSNLDDQIQKLQQHIAMLGSDGSTAAMTDDVQKWLTKTEALNKAQETLTQRTGYYNETVSQLEGMRERYASLTSEIEGYEGQLASLQEEIRALNGIMASATDMDEAAAAFERLGQIDQEMQDISESANVARIAIRGFDDAIARQEETVTGAEQMMKEAQSDVASLAATVKELEGSKQVSAFKDFPAEIEASEEELASLQAQMRDATAKADELEDAYNAAKSENELAKTASKVSDLNLELAETEGKAKEAEEAIKGLDLGHIINPSTLKTIGMTMSATITPFLSGIGYKMIDASSTVDAAYRDMRKTVQGTDEQFEALRRSAIDFSRTHVTSADQILQIEAIGGELGVATENLETFAEVISNLDVATNLNTEDAATTLGHLANILHLTEDDYVGFSDALVRLGNNGASTETEIANIAERIGSMGAIVGMSASDVLAWASSIASTGQNAEAAGTAISKTMSFFETAVAAAGGTIDTSFDSINAAVQEGGSELIIFSNLMGQTADEFTQAWESDPKEVFNNVSEAIKGAKDSLQGIADVTHMTADEFAQAWESDPTAVMEAFIKGLNEVEAAGGSADAVLQGFKITSVRQKQAIEGLMQTIDGLDDNLQMSEDAWNGVSDQWGQAGDAANEASKKAEGFSGQIQILKNMAQIALSELGEGAVPVIKKISSALEFLSTTFSNASTSTKTFIVEAGGIAALMGPMLSVIATGMTTFGEIGDWLNKAVNATALVKTAYASGGDAAVKALTGTMTTMQKVKVVAADLGSALVGGLQVAAFVAAIAVITGVLAALYSKWKNHVKATKDFSEALAGIGKSADEASLGLSSNVTDMQKVMFEASAYEDRLASLSDTINESNEKYGAYAGKLEYYGDVIHDLGEKSGLTKEELAKLSAAVEAVNDECGTTYAVDDYGNIIDTTTGKVQANTDAILANIDARKNQALLDYYADDYAQVVEQWAEAQDRVNTLQEEYNKKSSASGREEWIQNYIEKTGRSDLADNAYDVYIDNLSSSLEGAKEELGKTSEAMSNLEAKMDIAKTKMDSATRSIEESARAQEEFDRRVETVTSDTTGNMSRLSKAVTDAGKNDSAFNAIAEGLDSIHVYANELDNVDMDSLVSAFDGVDGSMEDVVKTLEDAGVSTKTWHAALEQAPEAAERMGSISSAAFNAMYETAGYDLTATMELIAGLNEMQVDGKTFFITDNGTIVDAEGRIYDINQDIADLPDEVISTLAGDDDDLREKLLESKRNLKDVDETTATPTVDVLDYASSKIDTIQRRLDVLNTRRASAVITVSTQATGGMNSRPVIPSHATGYIATGPTLTNQGWIGEDGIEAVANWATGGAVVPLTNKRYMLPIAEAIASGMAERMSSSMGGTTVYVNLDYKAGDDANKIARDIGRALERQMRARR